MKILCESSDYTDILIKKSLLEQAGFLVHMDNFEAGSVMPHLALSLGFRLWVPGEEYEEALAVLREAEVPAVAGDTDAIDPVDMCPSCGSQNVTRYRSPLWLPVLVILEILMPAPGGNRRKCRDCGHKYKTSGPELTGPLAFLIIAIAVLSLFSWFAVP
ncbi:putative signal transducing protein [Kordiimonas aestuarii]|uniref:putative signal transducing protein n=1 Tax=Kordiimonas aestuarii TaxID=1005925 RepID=UPI0021CE6984|nr:DUF2007 domain-containing protein [Kordiimonas aestuarii]